MQLTPVENRKFKTTKTNKTQNPLKAKVAPRFSAISVKNRRKFGTSTLNTLDSASHNQITRTTHETAVSSAHGGSQGMMKPIYPSLHLVPASRAKSPPPPPTSSCQVPRLTSFSKQSHTVPCTTSLLLTLSSRSFVHSVPLYLH